MIKTVIHIAIFWLLLQCGSQIMASNGDTAFLRTNRKIVECDDAKKSVIITLDIGPVAKMDSLFGYNYRINFDNEIIDFHTVLYINTLSEGLQYKNTFFYNSEGYVEGYGANLTGPPVTGDRPLLGLFGDFLGDCKDTALVSIDYLEFTDEFGKKIEYYNNIELHSVIEDTEDSYLSFDFQEDTVKDFNEDMLAYSNISLETTKGLNLEEVEMQILLSDPENFEILNVNPVSDKIEIRNTSISKDKAYVKFIMLEDVELLEALNIEIFQRNKTDKTALIETNVLKVNDCACITRFNDDSSIIKGIEDTSSTVQNKSEDDGLIAYYSRKDNCFIVESEVHKIERTELYNINGILMKYKNNEGFYHDFIDCSDMPVGAYILRTELLAGKQYINLLIKY